MKKGCREKKAISTACDRREPLPSAVQVRRGTFGKGVKCHFNSSQTAQEEISLKEPRAQPESGGERKRERETLSYHTLNQSLKTTKITVIASAF